MYFLWEMLANSIYTDYLNTWFFLFTRCIVVYRIMFREVLSTLLLSLLLSLISSYQITCYASTSKNMFTYFLQTVSNKILIKLPQRIANTGILLPLALQCYSLILFFFCFFGCLLWKLNYHFSHVWCIIIYFMKYRCKSTSFLLHYNIINYIMNEISTYLVH